MLADRPSHVFRCPLTDRCCRFYLVGACPYDGFCFDIHPKGPFDLIEHAEDQTTFFIPDEDQSDGE